MTSIKRKSPSYESFDIVHKRTKLNDISVLVEWFKTNTDASKQAMIDKVHDLEVALSDYKEEQGWLADALDDLQNVNQHNQDELARICNAVYRSVNDVASIVKKTASNEFLEIFRCYFQHTAKEPMMDTIPLYSYIMSDDLRQLRKLFETHPDQLHAINKLERQLSESETPDEKIVAYMGISKYLQTIPGNPGEIPRCIDCDSFQDSCQCNSDEEEEADETYMEKQ